MPRYIEGQNKYNTKQKFYHKKIWKNLRQWKIRENPLCEMCEKQGKLTPTHSIDHIIPFENETDPLATCSDNLYSLCLECHSVATAREQKKTTNDFPSTEEWMRYKYKPRIETGLDGYPIEY